MACPRGFRRFRAYGGGGGWRGHKNVIILRPCPKRWYLQRFHLFVQRMQGCGTVTSVHAFRDRAQNTGIYSVLCPKHWYKDVEQEVDV